MKTLLIVTLFIFQASAFAQTRMSEVELKKQYVKGLLAFKKGDYSKALLLFNKVSPQKRDLPSEYSWYFGKTLTETGFFSKGQNLLKNYIELEGEDGKYYEEALKQYDQSQELKKKPFETKLEFTDGSVYRGYIIDGKLSGEGTMVWTNGDSYEGNWKDNKRNGEGSYYWSTGEFYEGKFQDNSMSKGTIYWAYPEAEIAASYKGDFLNNTITGQGTYINQLGDEYYTGQWKNGQRSGEGSQTNTTSRKTWVGSWRNDVLTNLREFSQFVTERYSDGSYYEGYLNNNLRHGEGTYTLANGIKITTTWNRDLAEGKCIVSTKDSNVVFSGQCSEGYISGFGVMINQGQKIKITGNFYKTEFKNLLSLHFSILGEATQEGPGYHYKGLFQKGGPKHGTVKFKTGEEYRGDFSEGKFHGQGTLKNDIGTYQGTFHYNDLIKGTRWKKNGDKYTGTFKNGKAHGKGINELNSGSRYEGDFVQDTYTGKGTFYYNIGDRYEGEWENNMLHGYGWYHYANGTVWKGQFVKNQKAKECKFRCKKPLDD